MRPGSWKAGAHGAYLVYRPCAALVYGRRPALAVDQDARIHDPGWIQRALGAAQRGREGIGALAVVPGPVVATDGMVVRDRAAGARDGLGRRSLDRVPLLELGPAPRR